MELPLKVDLAQFSYAKLVHAISPIFVGGLLICGAWLWDIGNIQATLRGLPNPEYAKVIIVLLLAYISGLVLYWNIYIVSFITAILFVGFLNARRIRIAKPWMDVTWQKIAKVYLGSLAPSAEMEAEWKQWYCVLRRRFTVSPFEHSMAQVAMFFLLTLQPIGVSLALLLTFAPGSHPLLWAGAVTSLLSGMMLHLFVAHLAYRPMISSDDLSAGLLSHLKGDLRGRDKKARFLDA